MKKYKGLEILPGTEDDLLTVRIDIDRPVFEHEKYKPKYSAIVRNGFLAFVFLGFGCNSFLSWITQKERDQSYIIFGALFFFGILCYRKWKRYYSEYSGYQHAPRALARICESEVMRYEDGTPVKTVLKLMVDTTGGYRYLYLDVDDPEWTSPITGMIYVRAYENHVRLAETEEMRDTEEIQDAEEIRESASGEMWEFATEEISENENEITDKAE
ncbi:MAG: hypothetical protein IK081_13865 [Lachnospiraceae bacterium]|nr:hypothetical protein [Lachnospiraceae bacterium]